MGHTPLSPDSRAGGGPLRRVFAVLEVLAEARGVLTLSQLADRLDLPKSSLHRTMSILTDLRLAERDADKAYRTGDYLRTLARPRAEAAVDTLPTLLTPHLLELVQQTRQVASLAMLTGATITHTAVLHDHDHTSMARAVRTPSPAHTTAPGKLLIATSSRALTSVSLREELELVRRTGLAYARPSSGLVEVAAPLCLGGPAPVAAIVLTGAVRQLDLKSAGALLRRTVALVEEKVALAS